MGIHVEAFPLVKRTSTMIPPKVLSGSEKWPYAAHRAGERITNKIQWFNFGVVILWEILRTKLWANFDNLRNMTVNVLCEQKSSQDWDSIWLWLLWTWRRGLCALRQNYSGLDSLPPSPPLHVLRLDRPTAIIITSMQRSLQTRSTEECHIHPLKTLFWLL